MLRHQPEQGIERIVAGTAPKPLPANAPTHCKCGCGTELELTRRFAGYAAGHFKPGVAAKSPVVTKSHVVSGTFRLVRRFVRKRAGRKVKLAEIVCSCVDATRRVLLESIWRNRPPACCNKCRLRGIDARGFEAEHG